VEIQLVKKEAKRDEKTNKKLIDPWLAPPSRKLGKKNV
jgi:hypothetical protein